MNEKASILSEKEQPETRLQKSVRGALRWAVVALGAFVIGALIVAFTLYFPSRQELDKANANLAQANVNNTSQTNQISTLQAENATLQTNLDSATLHVEVLKVLSGVRGASLAVAANDYAGARLSLTQVSDGLTILSGQLGTDQKDIYTAMQQSAAQALTAVQTGDLRSAQPKLDQLTKNLVQQEANLFTSP
jgi:hypothetical protein